MTARWFWSRNRTDNESLNLEEDLLKLLGRRLALPFYALIVCFVFIFGFLFYTAYRFNAYDIENSRAIISNMIDMERERLEKANWEYGFWNESVEYLIYQPNPTWIKENLGDYLINDYGAEWVFATDNQLNVVYSQYNDNHSHPHDQRDLTIFGESIFDLLQAAQQVDYADPTPVSSFFRHMGEPYIVSASTLSTYEPSIYPSDQFHGILLVAEIINDELLARWSQGNLINDLTISLEPPTSGKTFTELVDPKGNPVAYITWVPHLEGRHFLRQVLPWLSAIILFLCLASLMFYRRLKRYHKLSIHNLSTLNANRQRLAHQANYDALTDLPNRIMLMDRATQLIDRCDRDSIKAALLYIDLDNFKEVNDTYGHDVGDRLLQEVAVRLTSSVRKTDLVSRFGGDEFCILVSSVKEDYGVEHVIEKIWSHFAQPCRINQVTVKIEASIGIVMLPDQGRNVGSLLRFADVAMYKAKASKTQDHVYYSEALDKEVKFHTDVKEELRKAIAKDELSLVYQPIYDLATQEIIGVEALLRWRSKALGVLLPEVFIPISEESSLIDELGFWLFEHAVKDIKRINELSDSNVTVSVNISVRQFRNERLPDYIFEILERYQVPEHLIQIEITENLLINHNDIESRTLHQLAKLGIKLVLDDFGTGYSSLSYINRYPLHTLKIDKSFVQGMRTDESNRMIIETIVAMAKNFKLDVIAEGIETKQQEHILQELGCTFGQGYLFSRPISLSKVIQLIKKHPHL